MNKPLHFLLLEDVLTDALLIEHELKKGDFLFILKRVTTGKAFREALDEFKPDIILSDIVLPAFDGFSALLIALQVCPDVPFLFVTGSRGEELVVETMKSGAKDYILKDKLFRLAPSVRRALNEREEHIRRRQAEEALRKSKISLDNAQRIAHLGNWEWDIVNNQVVGSDEFYRIFGMTPQPFVGTDESFIKYVHPDDSEFIKKSVCDAMHERKPFHMEFRIVLQGITEKTIYALGEVVIDDTGKATRMTGTVQDITERKRMDLEQEKLREQLFHSQNLASVGRLAGGVAHHFNNMLMVIIGYASLMQVQIEKHDPLSEYVPKIIETSKRAAQLVQRLLAFSRKQISNPQKINLNGIIGETESLLRKLVHENIRLKLALTGKDCIVMADVEQMQQVLMDLATNASDAMPGGGVLTISTDIIDMDDVFIKTHGYGKTGRYALMSFSDTGMGMDENTRIRLFEPFFTTKEVGKGAGLGLASIYGTVKQCNGYIDVESAPGKGTTFMVYLPLIESKVSDVKTKTEHVPKVGAETI